MTEQIIELLFFDTFAHDNTEEINLDLVQFPKPVYVTEVRIIPLGARVQADFPGGVRLGATNPSQFHIEFFVNDLGKPGASTFETLGGFEYDQNGLINLDCVPEECVRKIPTDGLVLKGLYTTITLAVYGTLTNNITEQIIQPVVNPSLPTQPNTIADAQQIISGCTVDPEWSQEPPNPVEYTNQSAVAYQPYTQPETYVQDFGEYYTDVPKDPRSYHHTPEPDWDTKSRGSRDLAYQKPSTLERERPRERDKEKRYTRSASTDRDRSVREFREISRERDREWTDRDQERQDYRPERDRTSDHQWEESDRLHERERGRERRHDDSYRRDRYREDREERKRPRTPPILSPKRPHTPQNEVLKEASPAESLLPEPEEISENPEERQKSKSPVEFTENVAVEDPVERMDIEEFEPILSDEDILDDPDQYQDVDYDYTTYTNNDDLFKLFTPGVTELQKFPIPKRFSIKDNAIVLDGKLKNTIGITDDYLKSSITKYSIDNFERHNTEIKEEFIHLCEKLLESIVGTPQVFCDIAKLHTLTQSMTVHNMSEADKELTSHVSFILQTVADWLKIALNYDMANIQDKPPYKIRHIKCGVRLAEWVCHSEDFIQYLWQIGYNIHKELLELYDREFMALSIKLMILKALDTYLSHKFGIEKFLLGETDGHTHENGYFDTLPLSETNGYKVLVESVLKSPQVRLRFAINSIIKKLNLYEILHKMHSILIKLRNVSHDISAEEINLITKSLNQILNYCQSGPLTFSQPKRFLPVAAQFEIVRVETRNVLVNYFKMFNILQCFILLLTYPSTMNLPPIKTPIFEIVSTLLENPEGMQYLSDNAETINVLLKCLIRIHDEIQYGIPDIVEVRSHNLGMNIAYKIQSLYHVERLLDVGRKSNYDVDAVDVTDQLHGLFCLTFSNLGKNACAEVLGMADNIRCLLQFFDHVDAKSESNLTKLRRSPSVGYIIDLICLTIISVANIPLLEKHSKNLLRIMNLVYDDTSAAKINELLCYVAPFEGITSLAYDNVAPYLEIVEKNIDQVIFSPGQMITGLRILQHLGISKHSNKSPIISENPLINYIELKYKHVILQLYSLDAITVLTKILQKICTHFEQPSLHSSIFVSNQGLQVASVIHPAVLLLKQLLSNVIQCRNTKFKDLTNIPVLLETYTLLNSFPTTSPGFNLAQEAKINIIDTLLVYTQPVSDEFNEKDSLNKTLWTQLCGEVIRYITTAPYTFVSGLLILSELLPLPLPIQTQDDLDKDEIAWAINLRKLWSAHLHPHSSGIQDMVIKLCVSTQPQLLNLLRRICVQLSDLAANSALMVARGILDNVYEALVPKEGAVVTACNSHLARLLNFLACLVTHSTIKCAVLHLIHTNCNVTSKTDEKYGNLIPAFAQVLKSNVTTTSNVQAQECILSIVQSCCDTELSLMQLPGENVSEITSEMYLAHALPVKEHLQSYIEVMLDHLSCENTFVTYLPIVRTLLLLTEHDYGFYHLRENMLKRNGMFVLLLSKLTSSFSKSNVECLSTLNTLVEFLRVCVTIEEPDGSNVLYTTRRMRLSLEEVMGLIGWSKGVKEEGDEKHALVVIEECLKKEVEEDTTLETILEGLSVIMKLLRNPPIEDIKKELYEEIILPQPESLLVQFSCRTIFSSSDACDERLTDRYWLATPTDEENDLDNVTCDLVEICRQNLSQDYNIVKEVEKLCRISRTEILDDKEKRNDDQKVKMKKPFVTPMRARGFARTVQQRPDLFRSRPPNTSRPPSLHVDDFVALETCGAQPTGPTGYNKISREMLASSRISRGTRGRAFVTSERSVQYNRQMPWWGAGMGRGPYHM